MIMSNTTKQDVFNSFHSHPLTKYELPEGLEEQWLIDSVAEYSLAISPIYYDKEIGEFDCELEVAVVATLGQMMYCRYLVRTLDRISQTNGFHGHDLQMVGSDESKRTITKSLQAELEITRDWLHMQKNVSYG